MVMFQRFFMYQINKEFKIYKNTAEQQLNKLKELKNYKKKIKLKIKKCFICNSYPKEIFLNKILYKKEKYINFPVYICSHCGMAQQLFSFDGGFHYYYYKEVISKNLRITKKILNNNFKLSYKRGEYIFKKFQHHLKKKKMKILDLGSGTGGLLKYFQDKGHEVYGIEPNKSYYLYSKKNLKEIINKNFEDYKYKNNFFDLVLIIGTLEHVNDPIKTINSVNKITKANSLMIIDSKGYPNDNLKNYFNFNHHRCFTKKTLKNFLEYFKWKKIYIDFDSNYGKLKVDKRIYSKDIHIKNNKKGNIVGIFRKNINKINLKFSKDNFFYKFIK